MLRSIETTYKGYRFRSRLEARWAVYFDYLDLEWEYEKEGFDLEDPWHMSMSYLPDFWLPQVRMWAEVKPVSFTATEFHALALLAMHTRNDCILLVGVPDCKPYDTVEWRPSDEWGMVEDGIITTDCVLSNYRNYPTAEHRFYGSTGGTRPRDFAIGGMFDDVYEAVCAARSARFESGAHR